MKVKKGISLIVLIISIIVIIVLAGAVIISVNGTGIIERAQKSKLLTEIREIQDLINIQKSMNPDKNYDFGTLDSIIEIEENNKYNNVLYIENGKLVYNKDSVTSKQAEWLEEEGIVQSQNVIPIYTLEQFEKIASGAEIEINGIKYIFKADATYNLQNDIDFGGSAENPSSRITTTFTGVLDGQNYKLKNVYSSTYLLLFRLSRQKRLSYYNVTGTFSNKFLIASKIFKFLFVQVLNILFIFKYVS